MWGCAMVLTDITTSPLTPGFPDHDTGGGWGDSPACIAGHAPAFSTVARARAIAARSASGGHVKLPPVKCIDVVRALFEGAARRGNGDMTCFGLAAALPQIAEELAARPPQPLPCCQ